MRNEEGPPGHDQIELVLLGPGYGECTILHVGNGKWVIVDSFIDHSDSLVSLGYLASIGVDPARDVALIVATHWHDDHIRGMARVVKQCSVAKFCCASALCKEEFLTLVGALEGRRVSTTGSGLREIYDVFSHLADVGRRPAYAVANRVIFCEGGSTISSLSPGDEVFQRFLSVVAGMVPSQGSRKTRMPGLSPNEVSVVLWVQFAGGSLLLGADLERKGWLAILDDANRPTGKASVFKIPHHGSAGANEPAVWEHMLKDEPIAVLTPWRRGHGALPRSQDTMRILKATPNAWITNAGHDRGTGSDHGNMFVERTLRGSGIRARRLSADRGMIRVRRRIGSDAPWSIETFGSAGHLFDLAA